MKKITLILTLFLLKVSVSFAQIDTAFWFAAPWVTPSHNGNTPIVFRIATFGNATAVRVHQIAGTYDTTINIPANSLYSHDVSWVVNTVETKPANTVLPYGFKISSDFPITVVYEVVSNSNLNPETFSLKGQNGLGTEFVCPFQNKWDIGIFNPVNPFSQINIVASQPNTVIWITPKCAVVGHPANVSYSITLNQGEAYTVQNMTEQESSLVGTNLSGTIIVSDKPVSVTVADDSVWEQTAGGCRDLMGDQIVPTDVIGTEYIVNIGQMNAASQEGIFMVATKNFTSITVNDGAITTYTLNQGDTKYFPITNVLTYVTSDKPIYVLQASGFGCELGEAILPPINCAGSNQVSFTRTNNQSFLLNILCKSGTEGAFTLNGSTTLVTAANFTVVPGTGGAWMGAQIQFNTTDIPSGTANLLTNSMDNFGLGVINGGTTTGCLYHYMSSFLRRVYADAGADQIRCTDNLNINLSGNVTGGTTTGIWSTPNGTGTFTSPTSLSTGYTLSGSDSTKNSLTFVLTSTGNCTPVSDTVVLFIKRSPVVNAGPDLSMCANNVSSIVLNGYFNYALGATWAGGSGGAFGNPSTASTTYTASPADIASGQILITLTSTGSVFGCPNTVDSMYVTFTPAPVVNAGSNFNVCANTPKITLNGSVSGGSATGIWTTTGSGFFTPNTTVGNPQYHFSAADLAQTSIIIKYTSTNNGFCYAAADSITVFINPAPDVNAGINDTICSNMVFISLNGSVTGGAANGVWSTTGTGGFGNVTNLSTTYTFTAADTATGFVPFVLTSSGGICPTVSDTVTYYIVKAPTVFAGNDTNVCDNANIVLNGMISGFTGTGVWTSTGTGTFNPGGGSLNTVYTPSAADVAAGSILLILTSSNNAGCNPTIDTLKITFIPSPVANFTAPNNCYGVTSIFTDASNTSSGSISGWAWDFGDASTSFSQNVVHVYSNPGTFTVTHVAIGTNGCKDTIQSPITIYGLPDANFNVNTPCSGNITTFLDTSSAFPATITSWHWYFGDGTVDTVNANPIHIYSSAGTYTATLIVETNIGCYDTIKKPVIVRQSPNAAFIMSENPAVALDVIQFTDQSTPQATLVSWFWNFGDSVLSNQQNPTHSYLNQGDFHPVLVVTDNFGCKDTADAYISVALLPQVPTAFTPNGDGHNDFLFVRGGPFNKLHFRVYNNWGELVFECSDQKIGWDGTKSNVDQPLGVYVWVMDVETENKKQIHKSGDITLMR